MRSAVLLGACFIVACAGCGDSGPPPNTLLVGNYNVIISTSGKSDPDVMYASLSTGGGLVLNFLYSISEMRSTLDGSAEIKIPKQSLQISHSTGRAEGTGEGAGSITPEGAVMINLDLTSPNVSSGAKIAYTIAGTRF